VLDVNLPAALQEDAEALHRTRVASRRLREVLPVLEAPGSDKAPARRTRGRIRRLTRALGGVRELDVALQLLDEVSNGDPEIAPAVELVRSDILRDRAERYARMIRSLDGIKPAKLIRQVGSAVAGSGGDGAGAALGRLGARVLRRTGRLEKAIQAAGSLYAFDRLHTVRIAIKKLRYALELVQEISSIGTARLVNRLKEAQALLGRLHDLEILAGYVRNASGPGVTSAANAGLSRLHDRIDVETRRLHAAYLGRVEGVRAVAASCRTLARERLS
jgi:CHAD domain-containing protein